MMMIAPCGFRCDQCLAFVANAKTHADRVRGSAAWAKFYHLQVAPQHMQCHGCAGGRVEGLKFPDPKCEIRGCVSERGLESCADCAEYPCETLESRMRSCDGVVERWRPKLAPPDFARFIAPYDCRATLDGIRKQRADTLAKTTRRKGR